MKKLIYLAFALLLLSATSMKAQVAIGTNNPNLNPHPGAILDLGQVSGNNLGLLLPKVTLTAADVWTPVVGAKADEVDGMLVYNDNDDATIENGLKGKGAYVWYDSSWHKLIATPSFTCGSLLKDIDGNEYHTANFGVAGCWMQENLKTTKYADDTPIAYKNGVSNSDDDKKEYDYPNRSNQNQNSAYGLVYTWAAASNRTGIADDEGNKKDQTPVQGVCPNGWHLPSDYEWSQLEEVIDKDANNKYASSAANTDEVDYYNAGTWRGKMGEKMKSVTKVAGGSVDTNGTSHTVSGNGFDLILSGAVGPSGASGGYGTEIYMWTSSSRPDSAWGRRVHSNDNKIVRAKPSKNNLFGVRCKKN